jgi:acetone carboxylase gamma subunit
MPKQVVMPIGDVVQVIRKDNELFFECTKCSYNYGSTKIGDPKKNALMRERSTNEMNPWNKYSSKVEEFVIREFYCPKCGVMISANVQKKEEPIMMDMDLHDL